MLVKPLEEGHPIPSAKRGFASAQRFGEIAPGVLVGLRRHERTPLVRRVRGITRQRLGETRGVEAALGIEPNQVVDGAHAKGAVERIGVAVQRECKVVSRPRSLRQLIGDAQLDHCREEVAAGESCRVLEDRQLRGHHSVSRPEKKTPKPHRSMDGEPGGNLRSGAPPGYGRALNKVIWDGEYSHWFSP